MGVKRTGNVVVITCLCDDDYGAIELLELFNDEEVELTLRGPRKIQESDE